VAWKECDSVAFRNFGRGGTCRDCAAAHSPERSFYRYYALEITALTRLPKVLGKSFGIICVKTGRRRALIAQKEPSHFGTRKVERVARPGRRNPIPFSSSEARIMNTRIPRTLPYNGRIINFTGPGRSPGALTYFDVATSTTLELYFAQIERIGPIYSLGRVANNPVMGTVRIDHASLNGAGPAVIGKVLIVGCLEYLPEGPRATKAWGVPVLPNRSPTAYTPPAPAIFGRTLGVITRVHPAGTYGFVTGEHTGRVVFVHHTQLKRGARLQLGLRVSYVEGTNERGATGYDVWPA
jgi:cold shock CspA family protein